MIAGCYECLTHALYNVPTLEKNSKVWISTY